MVTTPMKMGTRDQTKRLPGATHHRRGHIIAKSNADDGDERRRLKYTIIENGKRTPRVSAEMKPKTIVTRHNTRPLSSWGNGFFTSAIAMATEPVNAVRQQKHQMRSPRNRQEHYRVSC